VQIGEFFDLICSIYLYELLGAQDGQMKCNDVVSRDYCYLYVNIIRSYMCLGSNRQLWSRGLRCMCKINDYTVQHGFKPGLLQVINRPLNREIVM
jgi:hypothetical protein